MDSNRESDAVVPDKRVIKIAREVSSSADNVIPRLLLQLQGILDSCDGDEAELIATKNQLWNYELFPVILTALKQDFNKILDGWNTAVKVSRILVTCCIGWNPPDDQTSFNESFVPETANVLLLLANKLQTKYSKISLVLEDTKKQALSNFSDAVETLTMFCCRYDAMFKQVIQAVPFLQMLLTDDVATGLRVMSFLQTALRQKRGLFPSLDKKISNQILDELTYKLSISQNSEMASAATRTLVVLCESYPQLVEQLCTRYKGLRLLLMGRQMGINKMSNVDAQRLLLLLNMGNYQRAQLEKVSRAAGLIQAWWKSYRTRRQLKQADTAIARFQRSFRTKKEQEERRRQEEKMAADLEHMLLVQRRYTIRQLHRRQLATLEILPASEVGKHLANEQHRAAIRIQASWKGFRVRHHIGGKRDAVRRIHAAITIQRSVRKWLDKIHVKKDEPVRWQRPIGLTDDRRIELQSKMLEWRESHKVEPRNREQQEQLHQRVQDTLKIHVVGAKASHKRRLHREALLARIDMDTSLLLNAPRLCDVDDDLNVLLQSFVCHSAPVAARARLDHAAELRLLDQPWWRKLGDEYQDAQDVAEDSDDDNSWKVF